MMKPDSVYLIAEVAQAHDGSLGMAHSFIDALADTGVHAIKFQTHIAHAESSEFEQFRIDFSRQDATRYDYWKRMEFSLEQWRGLRQHCDDVGLEFMSSPFSIAAVELLEAIGVKRYKVGSGEVTNHLLLDRIAQTGKPVILSSGMSSLAELELAVELLQSYHVPLSILQCTTAYPTQPEQWGLNQVHELHKKFGVPVGFSDHSGDIYAGLAAVALGASILEFHVVFDKKMFGPDATASLTLGQIKKLVKGVAHITQALQHPVWKVDDTPFKELKVMFGKSLAVNKQMAKGAEITKADLESKKPAGRGIPAADYKQVIGRRLVNDKPAYAFLTESDLQ